MNHTVIVIPCYNEAARLDQSKILPFLQNHPEIFLLFVDDGSTDQTGRLLHTLKNEHPAQIGILILSQNQGKAEAVRQGILKALEMKGAYVGFFDADLSTPLKAIADFKALLDRYPVDAVIGARVKLLGRAIDRKKSRHYLGRIFATLASMILELPVYDTQCGAKIFRNSPDLKAMFSIPFRVAWSFDIEILARFKIVAAYRKGPGAQTAIIEHPLDEWIHKDGSKVKALDFFWAPLELLTLFSILHLPWVSHRYRKRLLEKLPRA
jgi:glycosyltransferase involved in cell wall biosynthesis